MAFSKTPTTSTYQTKMVPLVYKWDQRGGGVWVDSYDSKLINAIPEIVKDEIDDQIYNVYKRDGSVNVSWRNAVPPQPVNPSWTNNVIGLHVNTTVNEVIVITNVGTTAIANPMGTGSPAYTLDVYNFVTTPITTGFFQFADYVYENGDVRTIVGQIGNSTLNIINHNPSGVITSVATSADNGDPVSLDGYVFASDSKGNIWNSNLNDPTTWSASNFITAESYGDRLIRIARCGSYIVAFGSQSIEWFYDAANPTGSPLSVYQGATRRVGFIGGLALKGDDLYFLGKSEDGAISLYKVSGLKLERISDFSLSREYAQDENLNGVNNRIYGNFMNLNGHDLYVLSFGNIGLQMPAIYFDLEKKLFGQFTYKNLDFFTPIQTASVRIKANTGFTRVNLFCMQNSNQTFAFTSEVNQDDGIDYTVTLQTRLFDGDSRRNKFASRALVHADRPGIAVGISNCLLQWTIDDYRSMSTGQTIDLNDNFPAAHALGQFRSIGFLLTYTGPYAIRFKGLELDYQIGNS